jgi:deoxyribose-phosphate aldolase
MSGKSMKISREQLATIIDHTLLKPTATENDIKKLCEEAENYSLGCVCVNPSYVSFAAKLLEGTHVKVASTVGFPLGATLSEVKALETKKVIENGAREIDMVINIGALKTRKYKIVKQDIEAVVDVARSYNNVIVKAIIEAGYLTESEKVIACELAKEAGANFVKTSTGFAGGATVEDIKLMYKTVGKDLEVKAAGGIRTLKEALTMIEAGASRIGTSSGVAIIEEA